MVACDEPAASGVAPPAGAAPPPAVSLRWPLTVTAESKPVVVVSTVTRQPRRPAAGRHPWLRESHCTQTHPRPAGPRRTCRK
jgi:hypothetical protein